MGCYVIIRQTNGAPVRHATIAAPMEFEGTTAYDPDVACDELRQMADRLEAQGRDGDAAACRGELMDMVTGLASRGDFDCLEVR